MGCIEIGTGIIDCDHQDDPLHIRVYDVIHFDQELSRAGSIWNRSLASSMDLKQSDYFTESLNDPITFLQTVTWERCKIRSLSNVISFLDSASVSGGRFPTTPGGGGPDPIEAIFDSNTLEGMLLYVPSNGHVDLALADAEATIIAVGFANEAVSAAATGEYITEGQVTRSDWTAVAGTATLTPGAFYYASAATAGFISASPPSTGNHLLIVGRALTTTTLDIEIHQPSLV